MSTRDADDRREYYRIEDTLALEFRPAGAVEDGLESEPGATLFSLLSDLHLMDYESQHLLRHISERDRTLANYLKVMNKRIDLLGQVMVQSLLKEIGEPRKVSLSEGGVSFRHDRALPVGQLLVLRMVLLPQGFGLELRARVIHAQLHDDEFEIGTEFEALSDAQRQLLARHILQKQAQQRRLARAGQGPLGEPGQPSST
ncbi:PilZ domain-containing protein [Pseudomonas aeruginosa]|uniref:PilZ domain-containing protein n=1 Tax=Pseudomonas aeruginosa TaxID=287 RepID=UPI001A1E278F|nr:PilZ domain-containing protein [Pseudomonas aeruginosa]EKD1543494.1 PilZ domain-containing protein [Pseudomonas aeruginosa]EKV8096154.1 PilZ domain-containing protein [Pseudomonas aeruginosa]EKW6728945.1 PilZ domain-containing protein [Pseudomonas aeruginosa]MBG7399467.1 PilZ domain-containing protein [Pseudomonas aeruginosa]MCZ0894618.1 PilZ domain-containing protein [Pseudomonas aeruginosa]